MTYDTPGGPSEELKRRMRGRHRQQIKDAYDQAALCRRQYDEQRLNGDIDDELYHDLASASFRLYNQLRPAALDTKYEDTLGEIGDTHKELLRADEPLTENEDVSPKTFASMVDRMESVIVKSGIVEAQQ